MGPRETSEGKCDDPEEADEVVQLHQSNRAFGQPEVVAAGRVFGISVRCQSDRRSQIWSYTKVWGMSIFLRLGCVLVSRTER